MAQTIYDNQNNYVSYNGEPPKDGEILVPQIVSREYAELISARDVRTWYKCGVPYTVMFVAVPAEQAQIAMQAFNANLNDFLDEKLGPNRNSRCLIPQPDGSLRRCPKEAGGKTNRCKDCPLRGKLEKEDRTVLSLDAMDEENYHPAENAPSAEDCAMLGFLLKDLLDEFENKCPQSADIVRLGYEGLEKKEIIRQLPLRKSQAYQAYSTCKKKVEEFLKE